MGIPVEVVEEYKTYIFDKKDGLTAEEQDHAKVLGEKRKAFLKATAKSLGLSAKKLEKDIGKLIKKDKSKSNPKPKAKPKAKAKSAETATSKAEEKDEEEPEVEASSTTLKRELKPPHENIGRGGYYVNTPELLQAHLKATGNRWQTRFPPEPNGYLHIGHAKAMLVDFGTAKDNGGVCYLRFDDTNPSGEKQEYIDGIEKNAKWLGHVWFKRTFTSDYFPQLYAYAEELIRRGKAYVCEQTGEEVKNSRAELMKYHGSKEKGEAAGELPKCAVSPYRDRSVEENLRLFKHMRQGRFAEGTATLRMKMDLTSPNPNMWDQMAYRVIYKEHPRTKNEWCIYPTYDFSHCLVDSIENVTHSLCSLEFESRQSVNGSYHWLLQALDLYHPQTWEFSRCSISCNVMSKRRLKKLVEEKYVLGWDDPRLLTLDGLRRRGYTGSAINEFSESIGVARSSNEVCVAKELLEHVIRKELNDSAERRFAILDPIKVSLVNFEALGKARTIEVPKFPHRPEDGNRKVDYTKTVYIPRHKFKMAKEKGYKGLVKGEDAKLLYADRIHCTDVRVDEAGEVVEVLAEIVDSGGNDKGLASIPWVAENAVECEARLFAPLFKNCDVDGVEVNAERAVRAKGLSSFIELLNEESLVKQTMLVERSVAEGADGALEDKPRFQFITVGYFVADTDSSVDKPVFNRVITLKESKSLKEFKAHK